MVIHKVEIIDRQRENEIFIDKVKFFFKALFLPIILGILVFSTFKSGLYGIISAIGVFILVTYRKEIFGKVWGKRVWIILWLVALVLLIWQFYPYVMQEYKQSNYEKLCREECNRVINSNIPTASIPTGYSGYKILENEIECNCGNGVLSYLKNERT